MTFQQVLGDGHVHPDYSFDGEGSVAEYCRKAHELGLYEITFTPHYEITPALKHRFGFFKVNGERRPLTLDLVKQYCEDVRRIGEEYFPLGLKVNCGLEVGWDSRIADQLAKDLAQLDLDFVIGSVHEVDGVSIFSNGTVQDYMRGISMESFISRYFDSAGQMAEVGLFDVIAHLDAYKRYGLEVYGDELRRAHEPHLDDLFAGMKEYDLYLEVNTSAMRHGLNEYYPSMSIINAARRSGVGIASLGSDAHKLAELAFDFETAGQLVYELIPGEAGED